MKLDSNPIRGAKRKCAPGGGGGGGVNFESVVEGEIDDGALLSSSKNRKNNVSGVIKRPKWRSKQVENTGEAALLETLEKVTENPGVKKRWCRYFLGWSVACSIRKLGQRRQIMARHTIRQVLFEMEMAALGEQAYATRNLILWHA